MELWKTLESMDQEYNKNLEKLTEDQLHIAWLLQRLAGVSLLGVNPAPLYVIQSLALTELPEVKSELIQYLNKESV